jgi:hypothetical protein
VVIIKDAMSKKVKDDISIAVIVSLSVVFALVFVFLLAWEDSKRREQEMERSLSLLQDCLDHLLSYCKGKKERGHLRSFVCPLVRDGVAIWGSYECDRRLVRAYISSSYGSFEYKNGEVMYEGSAF